MQGASERVRPIFITCNESSGTIKEPLPLSLLAYTSTILYHLIAGTSISTTGCFCSALLSLTSENIDAIENVTFQYGENVPSLSSPYSYVVLVPLSESKLYTTSLERTCIVSTSSKSFLNLIFAFFKASSSEIIVHCVSPIYSGGYWINISISPYLGL